PGDHAMMEHGRASDVVWSQCSFDRGNHVDDNSDCHPDPGADRCIAALGLQPGLGLWARWRAWPDPSHRPHTGVDRPYLSGELTIGPNAFRVRSTATALRTRRLLSYRISAVRRRARTIHPR